MPDYARFMPTGVVITILLLNVLLNVYFQKTTEDMAGMDFDGAAEFAAMFEFYQTAPPDRDIDLTKKLNPNLTSFEQWVENNKDKIEAALE